MYDMYIAEAIIESDYHEYAEPEKKEALIDQVLKKHKISEARWDTSLSWYSDRIDVYLKINDSVKSRLKRKQKDIENEEMLLASQNAGYEIKRPDYIPLHFRIATLGWERGFKFKLDSTQLAERFAEEDTIFFRFKLLGIYPSDSYSLKSMLAVDYSDTTIYQSSELLENIAYSFPLVRAIKKDSLSAVMDTISSVNGFVHLSGKFPQVPIQLYQISLRGDGNNNDSIDTEVSIEEGLSVDSKQLTVKKDTLQLQSKMTTE